MVYFFYANIIGYIRVGLLVVSAFTAFTNPILMVVSYSVSQALDWTDGILARKYDQCTEFGGLMDMVTDRVSNAVILAILAALFPNWAWAFFLDIILDISSHWYQMYATLVNGESHHKQATTNWKLLHYYYNNYNFLSILIGGNQAFFTTLYLEYYRTSLWQSQILTILNYTVLFISFFIALLKKIVHVVQLISASQKIVAIDRRRRQMQRVKPN